ncbi:SusE domain-containing protein [Chitinophaga sp. Cy-1792]|uniref:SusE domain-containing protein n=1 Tax=Chitinophaga sp. Cy-1792 TaxID=2608339 RepID=UPI00141FB3B3|nr:SusE domain-containing protein [Chitinophaga sp. Cy-1792]NIG55554.1 SusF/SusE family outer membrane protein [Chitinophaga sp. Cy-1792]
MKTSFSKYIIAGLFAAALWSCKKDEIKTVAQPGTAPALTASADTAILQKDHVTDAAVAFKWDRSDFGFSGVVKYSLQFAKTGTSFANVKEVAIDTLAKTFTVGDLNTIANALEIDNGVLTGMDVRVKAYISANFAPAYSNTKVLVVSSYLDLIDYPSMYAPGDYQGWDPASAIKLASLKSDKAYEGYGNLPNATASFKFTSEASWNGTNYGGTSVNNAGVLSATGDNLSITGAGYYFIQLDLGTNAWSATKTTWSMTGDAAGGWGNDLELTYDATKKVWTATADLTAGAFKFRANHAYDINYGDNKPSDPFLNRDGANINVTEAGTYEVTLNLSIPGNYSYALKKK